MVLANVQKMTETPDVAKLEFYRLIDEGYKAMHEGRTNTIDEVMDKIKTRLEERS